MTFGRMQRVLPWFNRQELWHVYDELYSDNSVKQKHAQGRIAVWRCRSWHTMPVAIESTDTFISAVMEHQRAALSGEVMQNDLHLRTLYSMALLRFVNHITEKGQTKAFAIPIQRLAAQVGVPEWIVDLRHEAAHGKLPSLVMLKTAATWCLNWLKSEFWEKQLEGITEMSSGLERSEVEFKLNSLQDTLVSFQQQRFREKDSGNSANLGKQIKQTLHCLKAQISDLSEAAFPCLIEDGYLIPTQEQLTALGVSSDDFKISSSSLTLPPKVFRFWKPVVDILQVLDLTPDLLHHIVSEVKEEDSIRNELLYGWALQIISLINISNQNSLHQKLLIQKISMVKNKHSLALVKVLLQKTHPNVLSAERKKLLLKTMFVYLSPTYKGKEKKSAGGGPKDSLGYSVPMSLKEQTESQNQSPWQPCTELCKWERVPIGALPGQTLQYRNLELSFTGDSAEVDREDQTWMDSEETIEADLSSLIFEETEEDVTVDTRLMEDISRRHPEPMSLHLL